MTDDSDYIDDTTDPSSVSGDLQGWANVNQEWSGDLVKPDLSLDSPNAAKALAQQLRDEEPRQIVVSGHHMASRGKVPAQLSTSLRDRMQVFAEETVGSAIDWWPLPEPNRTSFGWNRVAWSCVSATTVLCIWSDYRTEMRRSTCNEYTRSYSSRAGRLPRCECEQR
jgi:hypothetical protein